MIYPIFLGPADVRDALITYVRKVVPELGPGIEDSANFTVQVNEDGTAVVTFTEPR